MKSNIGSVKALNVLQIAAFILLVILTILFFVPVHTSASQALVILSIFVVVVSEVILSRSVKQLNARLARTKNNEEALQVSEERFRVFMDTSPAIVIMKDPEGRYLYCNSRVEKLFEKTSDEIIGKTEFDLFPPEEAEQFTASDRQVLESGEPLTFEYSARDPKGVLHDWWVFKFPMYSSTGREYVGMQILDITQRKQAETNLAHERDQLHALMDNIPDTVYFKDTKSRFTRVNQRQAQFLGVDSPEEAIGKTDFDFQQEGLTQEFFEEEQQLFATGEAILDRVEYNPTPQGEPRWLSASKAPFRDGQGHIVGLVGISRDITERKLAEIEREKMIQDLESRNAELERFTYTVSHDLKSPLVTIQGFLGYLEADALSGNMERLKHDSQRIKEAVSKMQKLLSELLELSRIGRLMNQPEDVDFAEIVQDALKVVEGQIKNRGVHVTVSADFPVIYGDRARIVEVMQNLIDNACKYMGDQPDPQIEIGHAIGQDGKSVFHVRDNGIGIENKYHDRIFGLFNKLDVQTDGSGIGLALIKRIVEVHLGRIWVESDGPGTGSTFYFTLGSKQELTDSIAQRS